MATVEAIAQVEAEIERLRALVRYTIDQPQRSEFEHTTDKLQWALDLLTAPGAVETLPERWREEAKRLRRLDDRSSDKRVAERAEACADELDAALKGE